MHISSRYQCTGNAIFGPVYQKAINTSRLTTVSHEAKKKQAVHDERVSY